MVSLCGLALSSVFLINNKAVVRADTVNDSNQQSAISWDSDLDDSQVVKTTQTKAEQAMPQKGDDHQQNVVQSVQNNVEMSTVRSTSEQRSLTNQTKGAEISSDADNQTSTANLVSNVDSANSTAIDDPTNNQVAIHFVNRLGVDQNTGYIVDMNSNQNNIDYKLPTGYQLANTNEKYSTSSSTNTYYVFDKATQHDIDNGTKFVSTLNKELQNKVQMSIGWSTYRYKYAADNIKYQKAILKANYSIYGVPRSQVPEIVQSDTGATSWDVKNSTQFASKMGLSYDQLKSIVYVATNGGSQWMRLNAILANTTREVTEMHTQFSDQNAYKIEGNNVYVMVTKPQHVDPAADARMKATATRTIQINFPGTIPPSYKNIVNDKGVLIQTVTFTRTGQEDALTGDLINSTLTPWKSNNQDPDFIGFPERTLPRIPGYTLSIKPA